MEGNPIRTIRRTLLGQSTQELKKYLRTRGAPPAWCENVATTEVEAACCVTDRIRNMTGGSLDLTGLGIHSLPETLVSQLSRTHSFENTELSCVLTEVLIARNNFLSVPVELSSLKLLRVLDISSNKLGMSDSTDLSRMRLPPIKVLNISGNGLTHRSLEAILASLQVNGDSLTGLLVDHNSIEKLPRNLTAFPSLRELNFSDNKLQTIDIDLSHLRKLEVRECSDLFSSHFSLDYHLYASVTGTEFRMQSASLGPRCDRCGAFTHFLVVGE